MDNYYFENIIKNKYKDTKIKKIFLENRLEYLNINRILENIHKKIYSDNKKLTVYNFKKNNNYILKEYIILNNEKQHHFILNNDENIILTTSLLVNTILFEWIIKKILNQGHYLELIYTKNIFKKKNKLYSIQEFFSFDLLKYVKNKNKNYKFNLLIIVLIIFRVIYTIYFLQKKLKFVHNDLGINNIGLKPLNELDSFTKLIKVDNKTYNLTLYKFYVKIFDFEFSECNLGDNKIMPIIYNTDMYEKTYGITKEFNPFYDIYTFLYDLKNKIKKYQKIKITKIKLIKKIFKSYDIDKSKFMKNKRPKLSSNPLNLDPKYDYIKKHEDVLKLMIDDENIRKFIN